MWGRFYPPGCNDLMMRGGGDTSFVLDFDIRIPRALDY